MGDVARRRIESVDDVVRACHQDGHHWASMHSGWTPDVHKSGIAVLRKKQKCTRSGIGCGCVRIVTLSRKTLRPVGRPRIIQPVDSQGNNLYRYDRPVSRWELRAEEAARNE